jgi:hypothetical protein
MKKKVNEHEEVEKEIKLIKNPIIQGLLVAFNHPKIYIPVIILVVIIFAFVTIKGSYSNGKWFWQKTELKVNQAIIEKIKEGIK